MMRTVFVVLLSLLWISGCSIRPEAGPAITYYNLQPEIKLACTPLPIHKTVRLNFVDATPSLSSRNIVYTQPGLKTGHYLYSKWHENPNRSISTAVYTTLKQKSLFSRLVLDNTLVHSDLALDIRVLQFEHRFRDKNDSYGMIVLDAMLYDTKTKQLLANRLFETTLKAESNDAQGGVNALNKALGKTLSDLICWSTEQSSLN